MWRADLLLALRSGRLRSPAASRAPRDAPRRPSGEGRVVPCRPPSRGRRASRPARWARKAARSTRRVARAVGRRSARRRGASGRRAPRATLRAPPGGRASAAPPALCSPASRIRSTSQSAARRVSSRCSVLALTLGMRRNSFSSSRRRSRVRSRYGMRVDMAVRRVTASRSGRRAGGSLRPLPRNIACLSGSATPPGGAIPPVGSRPPASGDLKPPARAGRRAVGDHRPHPALRPPMRLPDRGYLPALPVAVPHPAARPRARRRAERDGPTRLGHGGRPARAECRRARRRLRP